MLQHFVQQKNKKTKHHIITNGNRDEKHEVQAHLFGDTPEAVSAPINADLHRCAFHRGVETAEMSKYGSLHLFAMRSGPAEM